MLKAAPCTKFMPACNTLTTSADSVHMSLQNIRDKQRREEEDAALDAVPTKASGIQLPQAPAQPAAAAAGEKRRNRWDQSGDT